MIYVITVVILVVLELLYVGIAERFHIIDKPNDRSSHSLIVCRGGGIIILFGVWIYVAFYGLDYYWFLIGLTFIGLVSFIDDKHALPDSNKLVAQFVATVFMFYQLEILNWHDWWILLIALVFCVGIINAYNFMDGINGITGGYSLVVLTPIIYLNFKYGFISMPFLYIVALSIIVFCFFNFRKKAICFAGDVGPITIAFILLFALGKLILQTGDFSYIIFLAVYGVDSVLTICHRIQLHENLGEAHRKHAYQLMANELKIPHIYVSLLYMSGQLVISFGMILCPINHYVYFSITIIILVIAYIFFMKKNYHLHEAYLRSKQLQS